MYIHILYVAFINFVMLTFKVQEILDDFHDQCLILYLKITKVKHHNYFHSGQEIWGVLNSGILQQKKVS